MSVAEAAPEVEPETVESVVRDDRAFLGHPKGLGYLGFVEAFVLFKLFLSRHLLHGAA
ncbi:hypothetical protein [Tsuneonella mangrovi]|uniref:hypothetical protein n=1 Tax=Tsuneonella mangrovi TaxID=1982042 RepID=UPI0014712228|nr:hypothetical protein [Tsuneonella mangrovi]